MSHELRTPITALQGVLENIVDGVAAPDPATMRTALAQTERLGRLVTELLDLSRMDAGAPAAAPGAGRRRASSCDAGRAGGRHDRRATGSAFEVRPPAAPLTVDADPARLHQVLANLLDNAARHSPPGGTVRRERPRGRRPGRLRRRRRGSGHPARSSGTGSSNGSPAASAPVGRRHRPRPRHRPLGRADCTAARSRLVDRPRRLPGPGQPARRCGRPRPSRRRWPHDHAPDTPGARDTPGGPDHRTLRAAHRPRISRPRCRSPPGCRSSSGAAGPARRAHLAPPPWPRLGAGAASPRPALPVDRPGLGWLARRGGRRGRGRRRRAAGRRTRSGRRHRLDPRHRPSARCRHGPRGRLALRTVRAGRRRHRRARARASPLRPGDGHGAARADRRRRCARCPGPDRGARAFQERNGNRQAGRALAVAAVSAALLLVFGALFASADIAFGELVERLLPTVSGSFVARLLVLFPVLAALLARRRLPTRRAAEPRRLGPARRAATSGPSSGPSPSACSCCSSSPS